MVTARMAGLSPGTSPPPVRMPMIPLLFTFMVCSIYLLVLRFTQGLFYRVVKMAK